jgi:DNA-directed RNA polymerase subunit beta'
LKESRGEVLKPETINYRTQPVMVSFCERIFGPVKILNVLVENTKNRYKGIICDRCGVEVTEKKVETE